MARQHQSGPAEEKVSALMLPGRLIERNSVSYGADVFDFGGLSESEGEVEGDFGFDWGSEV